MKRPIRPLPGEWLQLGADVRNLAAHPTRPWLAVHRHERGGLHVIEHLDLHARAVQSQLEVTDEVVGLVWMGDRVVCAVRSEAESCSVEERSNLVDLVRLPLPRDAQVNEREVARQPWGVEWFHSVDGQCLSTQLTLRQSGLEARCTLQREKVRWHPEQERWAVVRRASESTHAIDVVGAGTTASFPLPDGDRWEWVDTVGWLGPDALLGIRGRAYYDENTGLWCLTPSTGAVERRLRGYAIRRASLSPDGGSLAIVAPIGDNPTKVLLILEGAIDGARFGSLWMTVGHAASYRLLWLRPQTVVLVSFSSWWAVTVVDRLWSPIHFNATALQSLGVDAATVDVQVVGGNRLLLKSRAQPGTAFVTADVFGQS